MAKEGWEKGAGPYSKSYPKIDQYGGEQGNEGPRSKGTDKSGPISSQGDVNGGFSGRVKD